MNNLKIYKREINTVEMRDISPINMNPFFYYGTTRHPLLFDHIASLIEFMDAIKKEFKWLHYRFVDEDFVVKNKSLKVIELFDDEGEGELNQFLYFFVYLDHFCSVRVIPDVLFDYDKDREKGLNFISHFL